VRDIGRSRNMRRNPPPRLGRDRYEVMNFLPTCCPYRGIEPGYILAHMAYVVSFCL
jgi:hypothetical protein